MIGIYSIEDDVITKCTRFIEKYLPVQFLTDHSSKYELPTVPIFCIGNERAEYQASAQINAQIEERQAMLALARLIWHDKSGEKCAKETRYRFQLCQDTIFWY
jgi:hypothetical protein